MTRNSAEFRGIFSKFRTEYGIDGSKKTDGIRVDGIPWTPYVWPRMLAIHDLACSAFCIYIAVPARCPS
jgi:hypothetical protein